MNNGYSICSFDLPTKTKENKRDYYKFLKCLKRNGYIMLQKSVYFKYLADVRLFNKEIIEIKKFHKNGDVKLLSITYLQFNNIINIGENTTNDFFTKEVLHF